MSPSLMAILQRAERMTVREAAFARRWWRKMGVSEAQVARYGARRAWPDAVTLVRMNGAKPYLDPTLRSCPKK